MDSVTINGRATTGKAGSWRDAARGSLLPAAAVTATGLSMRVLIADDEPMVRAGVRAVFATDPDIEVVAEAADGRDAVEPVRRHRPAVAVLDIRTAVHHVQAGSIPRITRTPSAAASRTGPSHDGPSATLAVTERYADAEAPPVTSTAPPSPNPPGESRTTTPAPLPRMPKAPSSRPALIFSRGSRSMRPERTSGRSRAPGPNGNVGP